MENGTKARAKNLKNITILVCIGYLATVYLLKQVIISYVVAVIALILTIITFIYYRKAKREIRERQDIYSKPKIRRR